MRRFPSKLAVTLLAAATVGVGSWLLLADPTLGRTRNGQRAQAKRAKQTARPQSHGYGGYSGVCEPGTLKALSAPESFLRRGKERCFSSNGNPTGDNGDLSTEAFLAKDDGVVINMTNDTRRCVEGTNSGMTCTGYGTCPGGRCEDMNVPTCTADARGRSIFFIFDGNPVGQNADLGDELFVFDVNTRQLTQLTVQRGWCSEDNKQGCDKSSDCTAGVCVRARMVQFAGRYGSPPAPGLEVSPDGDIAWFLSDGDPGGNPSHATTQFVLTVRGQSKGLRVVGSGGKFCNARTKHPGMPCTTPFECGPVCGDGRKDPEELCEPFGGPSTCPAGQFCQFPGRPDECTCITPVCGNGILEPGEACDGPFGCPFFQHCHPSCNTCVSNSAAGAFVGPSQ